LAAVPGNKRLSKNIEPVNEYIPHLGTMPTLQNYSRNIWVFLEHDENNTPTKFLI
jgi:hypothetical protein